MATPATTAGATQVAATVAPKVTSEHRVRIASLVRAPQLTSVFGRRGGFAMTCGRLATTTAVFGLLTGGCQGQRGQDELRQLAPGQTTSIDGVTFTMHQKQAGSPGPGGWIPATSTQGRFTVRLPATYNDFSAVAPRQQGGTLSTHTVGTTLASGTKFVALCMESSDGTVPPAWATSVAESMRAKNPGMSQRPVIQGAMSGIEILIADKADRRYVARFLAGEGRMCTLSVEYIEADATYVSSAAPEFFRSFAIKSAQ